MNRGCVSQTNFQGKESLKSATEIVQAFDAILPTYTKAACLNLSGKKGTYTRYPQPKFNLSCRLFLARERHAIVAFFKPSVFSRHAIHAQDPSKYNKSCKVNPELGKMYLFQKSSQAFAGNTKDQPSKFFRFADMKTYSINIFS